jgi:FtsH-binding integral membrane protein
MIQRIQTVYLLLVAILATLPLLFSFAYIPLLEGFSTLFETSTGDPAGTTTLSRLGRLLDTGALTAWFGLMIALPVVAIFSYKKLRVQRRLCIAEIVLLLGALLFGWLAGGYRTGKDFWQFGFFLLAACVILTLLAFRGIGKDIKRLKSYDRIR